jgi:uncharacterized protein
MNVTSDSSKPWSVFIERLGLKPHPEGGFYSETYRSEDEVASGALPMRFHSPPDFPRKVSTAIYYLLTEGDFSSFHRIRSDELWHLYAGGPLTIHTLGKEGYRKFILGSDIAAGENYQVCVKAGLWFAAELSPSSGYCLTGCTVSPGFDFRDFEMARAESLSAAFPEHRDLITRLTRG